MKNRNSIFIRGFLLAVSALLVVACGGGNSGGTGNAAPVYSGLTTPADITVANVETLGSAAFGLVDPTSLVGVVPPLGVTAPSSSQNSVSILTFNHINNDVIGKLGITGAISGFSPQTVTTVSDSATGSCGGTASYTATKDDVAYTASGTITFNNYCEGGVTINGSYTFSASLSGTVTSLTLNIINVTITSAGRTISMAGSLQLSYDSATKTYDSVTNFVMNESSTGFSYQVENYHIVETYESAYFTVKVSGRLYHSSYGYIDVDTLSPVYVVNGGYPYAGEVKITGNANKSATFTFSTGGYTIGLDTDGVGGIDTTYNCNWSSGCMPA